jgi:hypothetical protein
MSLARRVAAVALAAPVLVSAAIALTPGADAATRRPATAWGAGKPAATRAAWGGFRPAQSIAVSSSSVTPATSPPAAPLRVELWGDSLSWQSASYWTPKMTAGHHATVRTRVFGGTAPCDWLPDLKSELNPANRSGFHPQVVVLQFVGNAWTPCMSNGTVAMSADEIISKYRGDLLTAIGIAQSAHATIYLASSPIPGFQASVYSGQTPMGTMYSQLAAAYPGTVRFLDGATPLEWKGKYTATLPCGPGETCTGRWADGTSTVIVRQSDGIHFCPVTVQVVRGVPSMCPVYSPGAARFAAALADPIVRDYDLG